MTAALLEFTFNPDQPRDDHGRWTSGGGGGDSPATSSARTVSDKYEQGTGDRQGMGDIKLSAKDIAVLRQEGYTSAPYIDEKGNWTPERQALHDRIVQEITRGIPPAPGGDRHLVMTGGPPGVGKSTMLESGQVDMPSPYVRVAADDIKEKLPESQAALDRIEAARAAGQEPDPQDKVWGEMSHEESSYISKRCIAAAQENGQNIVVDGCADSDAAKLIGKIQAAQASGYKVDGAYVTRDTDAIVAGAKVREEQTGRGVPEWAIRGMAEEFPNVLPQAGPVYDSFRLFDANSVDYSTRPPTGDLHLIADGGNGDYRILDPERYARFENQGPLALPASAWFAFNPDQPRDDHGRWTSDGGSDSPATSSAKTVGDSYKQGTGDRVGMGDIKLSPKDIAVLREDSYFSAKYIDANGNWTPERQALHDEIVRQATAGIPKADGVPRMVMTGGGPASGKTEMVQQGEGLDLPKDYVHIDPDEFKKQLPEVAAMRADGDQRWAYLSHEESSYLAKRVTAAAEENGQNIVLDTTGDSDAAKLLGKIDQAKEAGYRVEANYVNRDTDKAVARAMVRAEVTGRYVPEHVIYGIYDNIHENLPTVAPHFDSFRLYDANQLQYIPDPSQKYGVRQEGTVNLIAQGGGGSPTTILDQEAWDRFLNGGPLGLPAE